MQRPKGAGNSGTSTHHEADETLSGHLWNAQIGISNMQMPSISKSPVARKRDPQAMANLDRAAHKQSDTSFDPIVLGFPAALIAFIALAVAGRSLLETLLIAFGLQILVFSVVLVTSLVRAKSPDLPRATATDTRDLPRETADIWRVYPSCNEPEPACRIALISPDKEQSRHIATNLAGLGREVHHSTDRDAMLESVQARPEDWGLVIFDLDTAPNLETGVDDLLDFRTACPEIPVLLLSDASQRNDLSPQDEASGGGRHALRKDTLVSAFPSSTCSAGCIHHAHSLSDRNWVR